MVLAWAFLLFAFSYLFAYCAGRTKNRGHSIAFIVLAGLYYILGVYSFYVGVIA